MSIEETVILLQERFNVHIEEHRLQAEEETMRFGQLIEAQETNTKCIKDLTDSTKDMIETWNAADGTVKTLSALGKFVRWLGGFAVLGVIGTWLMDKLL